mmetsp:Transcript_27049/g.52439  ORF Transcript_27049/g.52439 Transcript_27049/m.52439 type:complete len:265 (-) Transcript_27049:43-837(-)
MNGLDAGVHRSSLLVNRLGLLRGIDRRLTTIHTRLLPSINWLRLLRNVNWLSLLRSINRLGLLGSVNGCLHGLSSLGRVHRLGLLGVGGSYRGWYHRRCNGRRRRLWLRCSGVLHGHEHTACILSLVLDVVLHRPLAVVSEDFLKREVLAANKIIRECLLIPHSDLEDPLGHLLLVHVELEDLIPRGLLPAIFVHLGLLRLGTELEDAVRILLSDHLGVPEVLCFADRDFESSSSRTFRVPPAGTVLCHAPREHHVFSEMQQRR